MESLDLAIKRVSKARKAVNSLEDRREWEYGWREREELEEAQQDLEACMNRIIDARVDKKLQELVAQLKRQGVL